MREPKIAPKGATEMFLRGFVGWSSDECLPWPYAKTDRGYGLAVVNGKQKMASHWMCIIAHGEPPFPKAEAAHSCGNAWCVSPLHVRWATHSENCRDKEKHGTTNRGERCGRSKLTNEQVKEIISLKGKALGREVAQQYPVGVSAVYKIWRGERWWNLKEEVNQ
jgi:hypothetical protein